MSGLKLLHFSDPHFSAPLSATSPRALLNKRAAGALNQALGRGRRHRHVQARFDALCELQSQVQAQVVLCTGDLTLLGTDAELTVAFAQLKRLQSDCEALFAIPGNHDDYVPGVDQRRVWQAFAPWLPEQSEAGLYWTELDEKHLLVAFNSVCPHRSPLDSTGLVRVETLRALRARIPEWAAGDRTIVVMTHYAPLTERGVPDSPRHGLVGAEGLLEALQHLPRAILLHGHLHHAFALLQSPWNTPHFCAGSLSHEGYEGGWLYETDETGLRAQPFAWRGESFELESAGSVDVRFKPCARNGTA